MNNLSDETKGIKEASRFTTKFTAERWVHISLGKAIAWGAVVVAGAFLAGFGGSLFVRFNLSLSVPGRVDALEEQVNEIQTKFMPLDLSSEKWKQNEQNHIEVSKKLDQIENKIDNIRNLIR